MTGRQNLRDAVSDCERAKKEKWRRGRVPRGRRTAGEERREGGTARGSAERDGKEASAKVNDPFTLQQ